MARQITVGKAICQDAWSVVRVAERETEAAAEKRAEPFEIGCFSDYGTCG